MPIQQSGTRSSVLEAWKQITLSLNRLGNYAGTNMTECLRFGKSVFLKVIF